MIGTYFIIENAIIITFSAIDSLLWYDVCKLYSPCVMSTRREDLSQFNGCKNGLVCNIIRCCLCVSERVRVRPTNCSAIGFLKTYLQTVDIPLKLCNLHVPGDGTRIWCFPLKWRYNNTYYSRSCKTVPDISQTQ